MLYFSVQPYSAQSEGQYQPQPQYQAQPQPQYRPQYQSQRQQEPAREPQEDYDVSASKYNLVHVKKSSLDKNKFRWTLEKKLYLI
jgi:hypothetical protein